MDRFLALFRAIGHNHLWYSRLVMPKDELASVLGDPRIESYALLDGNADIGLLELDFREPETCELAFFGLVPQAIGKGAGRFLMREALSRAWAKPIKRLWVHTCHFDHPAALEFYMRSGFTPYAWIIEIHDDPRLTGHVPRDACPQVPIIGLPLVD